MLGRKLAFLNRALTDERSLTGGPTGLANGPPTQDPSPARTYVSEKVVAGPVDGNVVDLHAGLLGRNGLLNDLSDQWAFDV